MEYRALGGTGLLVSEIGFGAWGIGASNWVGASEDESVEALHRAIELGVNFIDTARGYGDSERIVGSVVRDHADQQVYVATKVPPRNGVFPARAGLDPDETFPGDHIRSSLEESLRVSGLETFDVFQFHVWDDAWIGHGDWLETITDLKREGKIRFFGVSVNDYQPDNVIELIRSGDVDTVQVIYNAFSQQPEQELLPFCLEHGVGVIVRVALDEGGLTGRIRAGMTFPDGDFRNAYFAGERAAEVERRATALATDLDIAPDQLAEVALRYVLDSPAVSTVIAGMRSVRNVERNAATSDGLRLSQQRLDVIRKHRWERNFYRESP
jgi:aryl-alcohol dehydrogenase-like predicted oxidoreductase